MRAALTRRGALAGVAVPIVGSVPTARGAIVVPRTGPDPDAGLLADCAALRENDAEFDRLHDMETAAEAVGDRAQARALHHAAVALVPAFHDLLFTIADTPARTVPGLRAKLGIAVARLALGGDEPTEPEDVIALAALRDVLRLLDGGRA